MSQLHLIRLIISPFSIINSIDSFISKYSQSQSIYFPSYFRKILFTDEKAYNCNGIYSLVNTYSIIYHSIICIGAAIKEELKSMLSSGVKVELEALAPTTAALCDAYLTSKLIQGDYLG